MVRLLEKHNLNRNGEEKEIKIGKIGGLSGGNSQACSQRSESWSESSLEHDSDPFLIWKPDFTRCECKALSNQAFKSGFCNACERLNVRSSNHEPNQEADRDAKRIWRLIRSFGNRPHIYMRCESSAEDMNVQSLCCFYNERVWTLHIPLLVKCTCILHFLTSFWQVGCFLSYPKSLIMFAIMSAYRYTILSMCPYKNWLHMTT